MAKIVHKGLEEGKWYAMSLAEQLGNLGSEVSRMRRWKNRDEEKFWGAAERGFDLLYLTLEDPRWRKQSGKMRELTRIHETLADAVLGGEEYGTTLEDLDKYFLQFALLARKGLV